MTSKTLAKKIAHFALTKKANNVVMMDLRKVTDMADFFVVASANSDVQVKAIADAVSDGMDELGVQTWHSEGLTHRQWILLDFVDVVCHIFHTDARKFYALEKLWGDAVIEKVEDEPAAPLVKKRAVKKSTKKKLITKKTKHA